MGQDDQGERGDGGVRRPQARRTAILNRKRPTHESKKSRLHHFGRTPSLRPVVRRPSDRQNAEYRSPRRTRHPLHGGLHALSHLRSSGSAVINGQRVDVVTEGAMIEKGSDIKVVAVEGLRVVVRVL